MLFVDFLWTAAEAKPVLQLLEALDELAHGAGGGSGHDLRIQNHAAGGRRR
jgi:hypothetical protein